MEMNYRRSFLGGCFLLVAIYLLNPLLMCGAEDDANAITPTAWNDDTEEIWDSAWGGRVVRELLNPEIELLRKAAGKEVDAKYLKDTVRWLEHIFKSEYIPQDIWKKCVAVDSHILFATNTSRFADMCERIERSQLTVETYEKEYGIDTSGILVRYATDEYVILVVDRAMELCVLLKKKGFEKNLDDINARKELFWNIMEELFVEEIWKPEGIQASLRNVCDETADADFYEGYLKDSRVKSNEARLNKYFSVARVTLTPGPVIRLVFRKRVGRSRKMARIYIPKSRFEEGTLFDNQDFEWLLPPPIGH